MSRKKADNIKEVLTQKGDVWCTSFTRTFFALLEHMNTKVTEVNVWWENRGQKERGQKENAIKQLITGKSPEIDKLTN